MRPRKRDLQLPRSVYKSHGAYYFVRDRKWIPLGRDLAIAMAEYGRILSVPKGGMAELIEEAFPHITAGVADSTKKQYRWAADKLAAALKEFAPDQVTPRAIAQIKRGLRDTPNWANRVLTVGRLVFAYAVEEQLVDSNPCIGIKRHAERKRKRLLTIEEYRAIYRHAGPRLQIILDLLRLTGQRPIDVLRIRVSDLQEDGIYFAQQKTDARLIVEWTPELRAVVTRAKALHGNVRALTLLHNRRGKAPDYSTIKVQWDKARTAAKVADVQLRDLRAMALTEAKREGKNPTALAGHTSEAMTKRYLRDREIPVVQGPSFRRLLGGQENE